MHALHHSDRRSVVGVTVLAAALAIVVTLVLATNLSGLNSRPPSAGGRVSIAPRPSAASETRGSRPLTGNSLIAPLGAPIHLPWASAGRAAPTAR
jgi:hypothetical protein